MKRGFLWSMVVGSILAVTPLAVAETAIPEAVRSAFSFPPHGAPALERITPGMTLNFSGLLTAPV